MSNEEKLNENDCNETNEQQDEYNNEDDAKELNKNDDLNGHSSHYKQDDDDYETTTAITTTLNNGNDNNNDDNNDNEHLNEHREANRSDYDENGGQLTDNDYHQQEQQQDSTNKSHKIKGNEDERKIFVGGLTWETTKDDLIKYFSKYGAVQDANIKTDLNTGRSRGFGFVLFDNKDVVDHVLNQKDHVINGKSVDPKPAKHKGPTPIKKVFIGGLDPNFPESELREYFSKYGKIEEVELPFDKQKNQRRAFCFISFESEEVVNEIIKKPKHTLGGKEVDVKKATPPKDQTQQNTLLQTQWNHLQNWSSTAYQTYYPQYTANTAAQYNGGYTNNVDGYYSGYSQNYNYNDPSYQNYEYAPASSYNAATEYDATASGGGSGSGGAYQAANYELDGQTNYYNTQYDQTGYYQEGAQYDYYANNNQQNPAYTATDYSTSSSSHSHSKSSKKYLNQNYHPYQR